MPHLLSSESSAYYCGYVLAQMAVVQKRDRRAAKAAARRRAVATGPAH